MSTDIKDLDGGRVIELEVKGNSVFMQGRGFCYEFDLALFWHGIRKEVAPALSVDEGHCPLVLLRREEPACPAGLVA